MIITGNTATAVEAYDEADATRFAERKLGLAVKQLRTAPNKKMIIA